MALAKFVLTGASEEDNKLGKGFAYGPYGKGSRNFPMGFNLNLNCRQEIDNAWYPRYTYCKSHTQALPSQPTGVWFSNVDEMIVIAGGKPYQNKVGTTTAAFTKLTWAGSGSEPTLPATVSGSTSPYFWCNVGDIIVLSTASPAKTYKIYADGSTSFNKWNYLTGTDLGFGGPVAEHANKLLIARANNSRIDYSANGSFEDFTGDTAGYVNVGSSNDGITGLQYNMGVLLVMKENSIWAKTGTFSSMESTSFNPIYYKDTSIGCMRSVAGDNCIYTANKEGIYALTGQSITKLDTPFESFWQAYADATNEIYIDYWRSLGLLMVSVVNYFTLVYNVQNQTWSYWTMPYMQSSANCEAMYRSFVTTHSGSNYIYKWDDRLRVGNATAEETGFLQIVKWPWLDFGNASADKYIRRIMIDGVNINGLYVAYQNDYSTSEPSSNTISVGNPPRYIGVAPNTPFRRCTPQCYSTGGDMIVKHVEMDIDMRRFR